MTDSEINLLKSAVHTIEDYPKPGILFRDVTGILENNDAFSLSIESLKNKFINQGFTKVVGTEARGFLFGAPLALALGVGFVPVRKPGKLPRETFAQDYALEYGTDTLEIHQGALTEHDKVLIVDDLLATGGTIEATTSLIRRLGATTAHAAFIISLPDLGGEEKLANLGLEVTTLLQYEGE
jgi:adenine phosphoribosyltransferase